jgi:hypothetical protein
MDLYYLYPVTQEEADYYRQIPESDQECIANALVGRRLREDGKWSIHPIKLTFQALFVLMHFNSFLMLRYSKWQKGCTAAEFRAFVRQFRQDEVQKGKPRYYGERFIEDATCRFLLWGSGVSSR